MGVHRTVGKEGPPVAEAHYRANLQARLFALTSHLIRRRDLMTVDRRKDMTI